MKKKKAGYGGARSNAGRKKLSDKKIQIQIGIRASKLEKIGGKEAAKQLSINTLEDLASNLK